ncbi:MAG: hypothetical protein SPI44_02735 [Bacilli bacterium]|nr:hypothetical protein [Bacilli bacterium]
MKKIILSILLILPFSINAIEKIKINNEDLSPYFDNKIKKYNYFTNEDEINIKVITSKEEIISGDGIFELKDKESTFIVSSDKYGDFIITVFKNYIETKSKGEILSLDIEGYNLNFNKDVHEYNLNILDEENLNIIYELNNENTNVKIIGNGNFNNTKNIIKIILDDEEEYTINVFKAEKVSKVENRVSKTKTMSYTKKEIVKYIIITISCTLIFFFYKLVFISKTTLNVLPNTLRK